MAGVVAPYSDPAWAEILQFVGPWSDPAQIDTEYVPVSFGPWSDPAQIDSTAIVHNLRWYVRGPSGLIQADPLGVLT